MMISFKKKIMHEVMIYESNAVATQIATVIHLYSYL